ncbi:hypothetical protein TWF730_004205 [Orbilia blumenaviensis]|uniref:Uncharacterized protein n=1 Tax=Orbilia blumenaviensis TaxID=1796055 RepID=A0AAV9U0H1_9PEZI
MAPPATPRHRFPSPDDPPRPRTDPQRVSAPAPGHMAAPSPAPRPQFATPAPLTARRHLPQPTAPGAIQTPRLFKNTNRGFSPDPDFFTPSSAVIHKSNYGNGNSNSKSVDVSNSIRKGKGKGRGLGELTASSGGKRRRSFDLDEIDETLLASSGKPRVLGASSGGWRYGYGNEYFGTPVAGTPGLGGRTLITHATPTPSVRRPLFRQSSAIISSSPEGLNLSFGDTQEDVQDDSDEEKKDGKGAGGGGGGGGKKRTTVVVVPQKKRQKSVGVFDDIESIASSLPMEEGEDGADGDDGDDGQGEGGEEEEDGGVPTNQKENTRPSRITKTGLRTPLKKPQRRKKGITANMHDGFTSSIPIQLSVQKPQQPPPGEVWMAVPDQPQLKLPPPKSPTAKLNKAICAMAWSPSHRKRRNANGRYLTGGLAATVLGWAYDAQDLVLRNNMIIEQNIINKSSLGAQGGFKVEVGTVFGEEGYAAVTGVGEKVRFYEEDDTKELGGEGEGDGEIGSGAEKVPGRVILIGDENSALRKDLRQGSRVEVRPPTWEVTVEGIVWTVAINWRLLIL